MKNNSLNIPIKDDFSRTYLSN